MVIFHSYVKLPEGNSQLILTWYYDGSIVYNLIYLILLIVYDRWYIDCIWYNTYYNGYIYIYGFYVTHSFFLFS